MAETVSVKLTTTELRILIVSLHEALATLGDEEFAIRAGANGDAARALRLKLVESRRDVQSRP